MVERRPYIPRPYQGLLTSFILNVEACALWAGMGMGKGVATLTALDALFLAGESAPVLVMGPLRVARDVWPKEARKWAHLRQIDVIPIIGTEAERRAALRRDASVFTINYENLEWLVEFWGNAWPYRTVVADEATRLKNYRGSIRVSKTGKEFVRGAGSVRARALGRIRHTHIRRFIELTGTPSPNGLANLWGQMWFLDAGVRLGRTYEAFMRRWFRKDYDGFNVVPNGDAAQLEIQDRLKDICITVDPKDWFDLKEPIINDIYVDLPPRARQHYKEMEDEMFTEIAGGEVEAFGAAARTNKCLQLANGAAYLTPEEGTTARGPKDYRVVHDKKLEALDSCLAEAGGAPMLVSYEFKSDFARIMRAFPKAAALATKEGMAAFMTGRVPLGLAHPGNMGHGIDGLQDVCNIITYFGHNWDLEQYQQIYERIGPVRQLQAGFDRPVFVNRIIARDTVDELVISRRDGKRSVQDILMEAMKRRTH